MDERSRWFDEYKYVVGYITVNGNVDVETYGIRCPRKYWSICIEEDLLELGTSDNDSWTNVVW